MGGLTGAASNGSCDHVGTEVELHENGEVNGMMDGAWPKPFLTKGDLAAYIASGCKANADWRVGVEHEKFGFHLDTLEPMALNNIHDLLDGMASRFGYERITEDDIVVGLEKDGLSCTLEPGGQLELSGAPLKDIHAVQRELDIHLEEVNTIGKELDVGFVGTGYQPKWSDKGNICSKAGRYEALRKHSTAEKYKLMLHTCTVQVNLDFDSEQDMINKLRVGYSLQPIATALFASSPFSEGKPTGYLSYRNFMWQQYDHKRTGILPCVFDKDFGFEKFVEYALNVPMTVVWRNKLWNYVKPKDGSFKDFMAGELEGFEGERPSKEDWMYHLGQLYPEVRLKTYMEMRGADCGPRPFLLACPAFWVGLLYNEQSLQGALDIIQDWTIEEREMLYKEAPRLGLQVPFRGGLLKDVAQAVVKLAKEGLVRRGLNEEGFLAPIEEVASSGVTLAERMLSLYYGKWGNKVDSIFDELRL